VRSSGDFGATLRDARERRGIGLREIANETRISVRALEALERNDVSRLPGGIFSRAFVRAYAMAIGLDPEQTVDEFLRQFPHDSLTVGHARSSSVDLDAEFNDVRRARARWPWALLLIVLIVAAAYLLEVW
jgi:cytoskeletal protein RodZ